MKKWMRFMVLAVMPATMLVSCDEDDDDVMPPGQDDEARVMVVHASPDATGVDLLVDDTKVNSTALVYPENTGYLTVEAGTRNFKVNATGTETTVIDVNQNLMKDQSYSIFASGSVMDSDLQPLVITDDLTAPANGNAKIRFVHLSPDAPAVDVVATSVATGDQAMFEDMSFREFTEFIEVPAGAYDLQVLLTADGTEVLNIEGQALQSGGIYTVFAKGFVTPPEGNTNMLGAEIIENHENK